MIPKPVLIPEDILEKTLFRVLVRVFEQDGQPTSRAEHLARLAIGPVYGALKLAHEAYKLHIEALENTVSTIPIWLKEPK